MHIAGHNEQARVHYKGQPAIHRAERGEASRPSYYNNAYADAYVRVCVWNPRARADSDILIVTSLDE